MCVLQFLPRNIDNENIDGTLNSLQHAQLVDNRAVQYKLNLVPSRFLYRSDFVTSRRLLYRPDLCNCIVPYIPRTVPAYAVWDPAQTAVVVAFN